MVLIEYNSKNMSLKTTYRLIMMITTFLLNGNMANPQKANLAILKKRYDVAYSISSWTDVSDACLHLNGNGNPFLQMF